MIIDCVYFACVRVRILFGVCICVYYVCARARVCVLWCAYCILWCVYYDVRTAHTLIAAMLSSSPLTAALFLPTLTGDLLSLAWGLANREASSEEACSMTILLISLVDVNMGGAMSLQHIRHNRW